jgi:hypothetical protein
VSAGAATVLTSRCPGALEHSAAIATGDWQSGLQPLSFRNTQGSKVVPGSRVYISGRDCIGRFKPEALEKLNEIAQPMHSADESQPFSAV